jgi:hypothetical protein
MMNRVINPGYPNTIQGVAYQPYANNQPHYQYNAWDYAGGPAYGPQLSPNIGITEDIYNVAYDVYHGNVPNPVPGSTNYYAHRGPNAVRPHWAGALRNTTEIGNHMFGTDYPGFFNYDPYTYNQNPPFAPRIRPNTIDYGEMNATPYDPYTSEKGLASLGLMPRSAYDDYNYNPSRASYDDYNYAPSRASYDDYNYSPADRGGGSDGGNTYDDYNYSPDSRASYDDYNYEPARTPYDDYNYEPSIVSSPSMSGTTTAASGALNPELASVPDYNPLSMLGTTNALSGAPNPELPGFQPPVYPTFTPPPVTTWTSTYSPVPEQSFSQYFSRPAYGPDTFQTRQNDPLSRLAENYYNSDGSFNVDGYIAEATRLGSGGGSGLVQENRAIMEAYSRAMASGATRSGLGTERDDPFGYGDRGGYNNRDSDSGGDSSYGGGGAERSESEQGMPSGGFDPSSRSIGPD